MKSKFFYAATIAFMLITSLTANAKQITKEANRDNREAIQRTEVHLQGGKRMFIFFGPVRYNSVNTEYNIFSIDGVKYEIAELTCEGEGPNKCQKTPPRDRLFCNGHYVPTKPLVNTENEMIEDISNLLVEKETFQPEGKLTRTVCVKGEKGEMLTFFFFATWRKGTIEGNAEIVIETFDITDEVKLK